jgi:IclR family transcriptional regulator, acetate operon repressor
MEATARTPATLISSVQRALRLLEATSRAPGGAAAKQLARSAGIPIGTTYHLLRTLQFEGYLRRLGDGSYVVGDEIAKLLDQGRLQALLQRSRPALAALRDAAGAPAYLALYERGEIVVKDIQDGPRAPRIDLWVGFREAAHATALGRCVLAFLPTREQRDYLARHPLDELTPRTITTHQALRRALEQVRAEGFALEDEEYLPAAACVAAPVLTGGLTGAVAVSFPRTRLPALGGIVPLLHLTAERIVRAWTLP